ncbi:MAG: CRISPR-associated endonuclease Cas1 [Nocardioidaceae bacterium]
MQGGLPVPRTTAPGSESGDGTRANSGRLDTVNEALNYANTALYGVVQGIIGALGMSPGLGIVHEGNPRAFVLDIADLYKTDVTIPLAFAQWKSDEPDGT